MENDFLIHDVVKNKFLDIRRRYAVRVRNIIYSLSPSIIGVSFYFGAGQDALNKIISNVENMLSQFVTIILFLGIGLIITLQVYTVMNNRSANNLLHEITKQFDVSENSMPFVFHGNQNADFDNLMKYLFITHKGGYNNVDNIFILFEDAKLSNQFCIDMKTQILEGKNIKIFIYNYQKKELKKIPFSFLFTRNSEFYRCNDTGILASEELLLYSVCRISINIIFIYFAVKLSLEAEDIKDNCYNKYRLYYQHYDRQSCYSAYEKMLSLYIGVACYNGFYLLRNLLNLLNSGNRVCIQFNSKDISDPDSQFIFEKLQDNKVYTEI
jgi:hypothetical protein